MSCLQSWDAPFAHQRRLRVRVHAACATLFSVLRIVVRSCFFFFVLLCFRASSLLLDSGGQCTYTPASAEERQETTPLTHSPTRTPPAASGASPSLPPASGPLMFSSRSGLNMFNRCYCRLFGVLASFSRTRTRLFPYPFASIAARVRLLIACRSPSPAFIWPLLQTTRKKRCHVSLPLTFAFGIAST